MKVSVHLSTQSITSMMVSKETLISYSQRTDCGKKSDSSINSKGSILIKEVDFIVLANFIH